MRCVGFCISNRFVRQSLCLEHPVYKVDIIYSVPTIHAHIPYGNDGHTCREEGAFSDLEHALVGPGLRCLP